MKLDELKVQSFVTEKMDENTETIKGGFNFSNFSQCICIFPKTIFPPCLPNITIQNSCIDDCSRICF